MGPRRVDKEARRERLLGAAATVFAEFGYRRATMEQVADAAGVAKGSVYLAFDSKEDLFFAVFEEFMRDFVGNELHADQPSDTGVLDQIEETLVLITRAVEDDPIAIPLTLEFWAVCGVEETRARFGALYAESIRAFTDRIVALLERGQALGEVDPAVPVRPVASCIVALVDGLHIQQWTLTGFSASATLKDALAPILQSLRAG